MFIKVTNHSDDKTIILNTDFIRSIEPKVYDDGKTVQQYVLVIIQSL